MNWWYFADVPVYAGVFAVALAWAWFRGRPKDHTAQSWRMTMAEVASGKVVGVIISYCMNLWLLPLLVHSEINPREAASISALYLAVATIRSLITRRIFEHLRIKGVN